MPNIVCIVYTFDGMRACKTTSLRRIASSRHLFDLRNFTVSKRGVLSKGTKTKWDIFINVTSSFMRIIKIPTRSFSMLNDSDRSFRLEIEQPILRCTKCSCYFEIW